MANWLRNTTYATLLALSLGCGGSKDIPRTDVYLSQEDLETILDDVQVNNDVLAEDVNLNDIYGEDINLEDTYREDIKNDIKEDLKDIQGEELNLNDIQTEEVNDIYSEDVSVKDYEDLNLEDVLGNEDSVDNSSDLTYDVLPEDYVINEDVDPCANNHAPTIEAWIDNPKPNNTYAPLEDIIICMNVTDQDNNFDHCYISNYQYIDEGTCDCLSTYFYSGDEVPQEIFVGVTDFCDAVAYKSFNVIIE